MGKLKYLKKLLGLLQNNDDKIAKQVSKKTSKLDEDQVKKGINKASDKVDGKNK